MATTLIDHATAERAVLETALTRARARLASGQAELATAQARLDADLAELAALEAAIAKNRAALSSATVPAEVDALGRTLTDQTVQQHQLQGRLRDDRDAVEAPKAALAFAQLRLARAQAHHAEAEKRLKAETEAHQRRQGWVQAASEPPLDTLMGEADAVLEGTGSTLLADATAKFTTSPVRIPAELLDAASRRYALWRGRQRRAEEAVKKAEDALGAQHAADGGLPGAAAEAGLTFRRAEGALGDYVSSALARYERAVATLTALAALGQDVFALSANEAAAANDAALLGARQAAQADEAAILPAQAAHDVALAALQDAELAAQAKDPNQASLAGDADYDAAVAEVEAKKTALDAAAAELNTTERQTLAHWQVRLSDATWRRLLEFIEAKAELTWLQATDPVALVDALETAEGEYGDALAAAAASRRSLEFLEDTLALRTSTAAALNAGLSARLFSAVRGDAH
jgi:transposase InsO family protein